MSSTSSWHGRLISKESYPLHAWIAARNIPRAGLSDRMDIRVGAALTVLPSLRATVEAPFDMVFIDADKAPYKEYFRWSLKLKRSGSLIIADNVIRKGQGRGPAEEQREPLLSRQERTMRGEYRPQD